MYSLSIGNMFCAIAAAPLVAMVGFLIGDSWRPGMSAGDYGRACLAAPSALVRAVARDGWSPLRQVAFAGAAGLAFAALSALRWNDVLILLPAIAGAAAAARSDTKTFEVHELSAALIGLSGLMQTVWSPDPVSHLVSAMVLIGAFGLPHAFAAWRRYIPCFPGGDLMLVAALGLNLTAGQLIVFGASLCCFGIVFLAARRMRLLPIAAATPGAGRDHQDGSLSSESCEIDPFEGATGLVPFAPILIAAAVVAHLAPPLFAWAGM